MNHQGPDLRLEIASNPNLLPAVRGMVSGLCERFNFSPVEIGHICLALDEGLANVIRHGYDSQLDGRIWISCTIMPGPPIRLRLEIEDEGRQTRSRDLHEIRPGGLGVHIMREVMDLCEFTTRESTGMRLVLEKEAADKVAHTANIHSHQGYE